MRWSSHTSDTMKWDCSSVTDAGTVSLTLEQSHWNNDPQNSLIFDAGTVSRWNSLKLCAGTVSKGKKWRLSKFQMRLFQRKKWDWTRDSWSNVRLFQRQKMRLFQGFWDCSSVFSTHVMVVLTGARAIWHKPGKQTVNTVQKRGPKTSLFQIIFPGLFFCS